eukprot:COSAG01_NODE_41_length_32446_cov_41.218877_21_plen_182_part_00
MLQVGPDYSATRLWSWDSTAASGSTHLDIDLPVGRRFLLHSPAPRVQVASQWLGLAAGAAARHRCRAKYNCVYRSFLCGVVLWCRSRLQCGPSASLLLEGPLQSWEPPQHRSFLCGVVLVYRSFLCGVVLVYRSFLCGVVLCRCRCCSQYTDSYTVIYTVSSKCQLQNVRHFLVNQTPTPF